MTMLGSYKTIISFSASSLPIRYDWHYKMLIKQHWLLCHDNYWSIWLTMKQSVVDELTCLVLLQDNN